jgi:DNA-binding beta-propeller fold protein YncE
MLQLATYAHAAETVPPVTTPSPIMGTYGTTQNVTLTCTDGSGSGCANTYYCLGSGCTPATPYSGPVSIAATTSLSFYSTDLDGNTEQVRTYAYTIDPTQAFRFERLWPELSQPWPFGGSYFAFDSSGNVYVADSANNRIKKFDANGFFVASWGSSGNGNGQFNNPYYIAVDSAGNVYVTDSNNHRIQKFTATGVFLTKWGTNGSGNGQLYWPRGIAVDSAGNVFVADGHNYRVQKFTSDGTFVTKWGTSGTATGQFDTAQAIAVDSFGNVYVSESNNNRIQKFDNNGGFLATWGATGSENGQFNYPLGIAIDSAGDIYVSDANNNRVQKFTPAGLFITKWSPASGGSSPNGIAINPQGVVYINALQLQKFTSSGVFLGAIATSGNSAGVFKSPQGIAVDPSGNFYVADSSNHRIQKFNSAGAFVTTWGTFGSSNGKFSFPNCITADQAGNLYVVDSGNNRVQKFSSTGTYLISWGGYGSGNGQFKSPYGIAVSPTGDIYVAESGNNRVQKFDANGTFISSWGTTGSAAGQFNGPQGIAVDSLGNVYVVDSTNSRIQKFDANGTFIVAWGSAGAAAGQFVGPRSISVGPADNVYVADTYNNRLQQFTSAGAYVTSLGNIGSGIGQFMYPEGIDIDAAGFVYVADTNNHRIQKFIPSSAPNTPGAPTGVTAAAGNGQATVAFTAPATNGGSAITTYTVTSTPDNLTASGTASPLTITGLTNGTPYTFTVTATNGNGTGPASNASNSIVPGFTTYALALTVNGTGTIHSTPAPDINCTGSCNQSFDSGTLVNLTASPGSGHTFSGWSGACSGSGSCNVTMSQARSVTATFAYALPGAPTGVTATAGTGQATVTFTAPASNGGSPITSYTVTSSPGNISVSGGSSPITISGLTNGTAYTFTVVATNANGSGTASGPSNSVTPLVTTYSLSLVVNGSGTVHSTPAPDINCSGSCGQSYDSGTNVTLTATPGSGYSFSGWSACTGTGSCIVTMSQARSVTAFFTLIGFSNGACGSAHNSNYSTLPTLNLCTAGTPSTVNGIGPWTWACAGVGGGTTASCSAAQAGGIVHRSSDSGVTWTAGKAGIGFNEGTNTILPSPFYASDRTLFIGTTNGIYRSSDSGDSWMQVHSNYRIMSLAASPAYASDHTLFAGAFLSGFYKSTDGGSSWYPSNTGLGDTRIASLAVSPAFATDRTLYAGLYFNGVYKSSDGGASWSAVNTGIDALNVNAMAISPAFVTDRTIFAVTSDGIFYADGQHYHVFKSTNAGTTWSLADSGLSGAVTSLAISPAFASDQTLFAATATGTYKTTDSGNTWTRVHTAVSGNSVVAISPAYASDQTVLVSVFGDNVYRSSNGGSSWSPANNDFSIGSKKLSALALSPAFASDHAVFAATALAGPYIWHSPSDLSFGAIRTGSTSTVQKVTITNGYGQFGDANLAITGMTLSGAGAGQFSLSPGSCGTLTPVLPVGSSCSVDITFAPVSSGSITATVWINSNDVMNSSSPINLSGTGVTVSSTVYPPFISGNTAYVNGTASCSAGATITLVEVSYNGGGSWQPASGTTSWSISLPLPDGSYPIKSRATTSTGMVESPGPGLLVTLPGPVDTEAPTGTLMLVNGVWTLNANARDGQACVQVYPSICGVVEMSLDGSNWQPATTTPGTGGPIWLRDRAGNISQISNGITAASTITSPATGSYTNATSMAVAGTAGCSGGSVTAVDVSANNGATWSPASGTTSWSTTLSLPATGTYSLKSRATCSGGIVETPGAGITLTVDRTPPSGTLALYYGVWTLNASDAGLFCIMGYPFICGQLQMSTDGSAWQPATATPGTGGPLWLRDLAGNTTIINGFLANPNGGPIRIEGGSSTYYSLLQHAVNGAGSGDVIKLTGSPCSENLLVNTPSALTVRGGYNGSYSAIAGTTQLTGTLTVQAGELTMENIDLSGVMEIHGGSVMANTLSVL